MEGIIWKGSPNHYDGRQGNKVDRITLHVMAMASACSTFVSQNCGANQPERVRKGMKEIALYSVAVAVLAVLLMQLGAEWMVQLISGSNEPVVLENGARYLRWNAPFYAVLGVLLATRYALQSLGQKVLPLFSVSSSWWARWCSCSSSSRSLPITPSSSVSPSSGALWRRTSCWSTCKIGRASCRERV